ncbi:MAG: hypothetical protein V5A82_03100 [Haloferacaceae archaeon]
MNWTRRRVLAGGSAVVSAVTGGCLGLNPLSGGGSTGGSDAAGDRSTPTPAASPTPTPTPTPAVSRSDAETDRVFAEVEWFARQYQPTVERYRSTGSRALSLLETLARQSSLSRRDLERLRALLGEVTTVLYDGLAAHFDAEPTVRSYNEARIAELQTLREREDWDAVQRVLGEMASRYETLVSEEYVARTFPTDPIGGRFARLLTGDGRAERAAVLVYYAPTDYLGRVQVEEYAGAGALAGGRRDLAGYDRTFDATGIAAYRTARAYLTFTDLSHGQRAQPVYVQQYEDEARAEGAVRRMLSASGAVTAEGTRTLGGREWREVFYQANGGVTYAFLLRTGRYTLVAAPSRTPWDERGDEWATPLSLGWFWE